MDADCDYLSIDGDSAEVSLTLRFRRLAELKLDTDEAAKQRLSLHNLLISLENIETLDGCDMAIAELLSLLPPHCCACGKLMDPKHCGDEFPEERCHEDCEHPTWVNIMVVPELQVGDYVVDDTAWKCVVIGIEDMKDDSGAIVTYAKESTPHNRGGKTWDRRYDAGDTVRIDLAKSTGRTGEAY